MMYWHSRNNIEAAAMDGSQHHSLVNQADYVTSLTIDSKGTFHDQQHILYASKYWCNKEPERINNLHTY